MFSVPGTVPLPFLSRTVYKVPCERTFAVPGTVHKVPCERTFAVPGTVHIVPCERTFAVPRTVHKVPCERTFAVPGTVAEPFPEWFRVACERGLRVRDNSIHLSATNLGEF